MIFASNNKGKIAEIKAILKDYEIVSLKEAGVDIDVEEDKDSFYGNAQKKAVEIYNITKEPVIADDSGLCITAFDNWPGVMTHRFLGDDATDRERNEAILDKMKNLTGDKRNAKVVCCLVYFDGGNELVAYGSIQGKISVEVRGKNGFGFDEIFEIKSGKTLAEVTEDEKNNLSARALAAEKLNKMLSTIKMLNKMMDS